MNYRKHYNALIKKSQERILEGYVEKHHIIPKCMGGTDDISNIVVLTAEEHFIAHLLLVKIYPQNHKLVFAANMMCSNNPFQRRGNKVYSWLKKKVAFSFSKAPRKKRTKETKPRKKRNLTNEHKKKIGISSSKEIVVDGIIYTSKKEAYEKLGIKRTRLDSILSSKVDGRKVSANERPSYYCECCNLTVKGESNWKQHLKSKKHILRCDNL